jgi:hypothetical protein
VGLTVELQDENGDALDAVEDLRNLLHAALPSPDDAQLSWAGTIDWYGDTTFNRLQAGRLRNEWARLEEATGDPDTRALLRRIRELLERCASGVHLYVKFIGD